MFLGQAKVYPSIKQALLLLCFLLFLFQPKSQNLSLQHFDADDGLPSSEVYRVFPDKTGRLWFCTDRGIAFYDSYKFTKIESINEDQVFLDGYCDEDGVCWFQSINNNFYLWKNNKIEEFELNKFLQPKIKNENISNWKYKNSKFYFTTNYTNHIKGVYTVKNNKIDTQFFCTQVSDEGMINNNLSYTIRVHKFDAFYEYYSFTISDNNNIKINKVHENGLNVSTNLCLTQGHHLFLSYKIVNNEIKIIQIFNKLFLSDGKSFKQITKDMDLITIRQVRLIDSIIYITNSIAGIKTINLRTFQYSVLETLKNVLVTSINYDNEQNIWITTTQEGVYMIPRNKNIEFLKDLNIKYICKTNTGLWYSSKLGTVGFLDNAGNQIRAYSFRGENPFIFKTNNNILINGSQSIEYVNFNTNKYNNNWIKGGVNLKNEMLFINTNAIIRIKNKLTQIVKRFAFKLYSIYAIDQENLLIGYANGLFSYNLTNKSIKYYNVNNFRVSHIVKFNEFYLLSTLGDGIYFYDLKKESIVFKINKENGLTSNNVNSTVIQNNNYIWVSTNNGLCQIKLSNKINILGIKYFDKKTGLLSNEINCMEIDNENIYIGTTKGISILKLNQITVPVINPTVNIVNVNTISEMETRSTRYEFGYKENNIKIDFSAYIIGKSMVSPTYSYALLKSGSKDTEWLSTNLTSLQFTNLDPGNYSFIVKAQSRYGGFGLMSKYDFRIIPHFTQTFWFKIFIGLVLLGIVFIIFYLRLSNVRNKSKLKQTIKTAQLESLRNQMNPHFIFNALNSVQNLIYANKNEEAGDFLGKISRMFRDALEFSRNSTIPLSVELEFIKRYLEIEKLRFPNKLAYSFFVSPEIENNMDAYEIPPLLMQPLIENSVKHGLKNISSIGTISISVIRNGDFIVYTMEDDCGGFSENLSTTHTSRGLSIIRDRINILNQIESQDSGYNFELINTPQKGVKAIITIPIN